MERGKQRDPAPNAVEAHTQVRANATISPAPATNQGGAAGTNATKSSSASASSSSSASSQQRRRVAGDYEMDQRIGYGSFANVYRAHHYQTGLVVAVKAINKEKVGLNARHAQSLRAEMEIMKRLLHKNIVRFLDVHETKNHTYIVMTHCAGGDLSKYIKKYGKISEADARFLMGQLADGLRYLHDKRLVHRDLKPQNILLDKQTTPATLRDVTIKIADFGFARHMEHNSMAATLCGSPLYMAPEILRYQKYDHKADLWSVGTILYEMLVGQPPFTGANHVQLLQRIEATANDIKFPSTVTLSSECKDLIRRLLRKDPKERLTFSEFFSHPFIAHPEKDKEESSSEDENSRRFLTAVRNTTTETKDGKSSDDTTAVATDKTNAVTEKISAEATVAPVAITQPFDRSFEDGMTGAAALVPPSVESQERAWGHGWGRQLPANPTAAAAGTGGGGGASSESGSELDGTPSRPGTPAKASPSGSREQAVAPGPATQQQQQQSAAVTGSGTHSPSTISGSRHGISDPATQPAQQSPTQQNVRERPAERPYADQQAQSRHDSQRAPGPRSPYADGGDNYPRDYPPSDRRYPQDGNAPYEWAGQQREPPRDNYRPRSQTMGAGEYRDHRDYPPQEHYGTDTERYYDASPLPAQRRIPPGPQGQPQYSQYRDDRYGPRGSYHDDANLGRYPPSQQHYGPPPPHPAAHSRDYAQQDRGYPRDAPANYRDAENNYRDGAHNYPQEEWHAQAQGPTQGQGQHQRRATDGQWDPRYDDRPSAQYSQQRYDPSPYPPQSQSQSRYPDDRYRNDYRDSAPQNAPRGYAQQHGGANYPRDGAYENTVTGAPPVPVPVRSPQTEGSGSGSQEWVEVDKGDRLLSPPLQPQQQQQQRNPPYQPGNNGQYDARPQSPVTGPYNANVAPQQYRDSAHVPRRLSDPPARPHIPPVTHFSQQRPPVAQRHSPSFGSSRSPSFHPAPHFTASPTLSSRASPQGPHAVTARGDFTAQSQAHDAHSGMPALTLTPPLIPTQAPSSSPSLGPLNHSVTGVINSVTATSSRHTPSDLPASFVLPPSIVFPPLPPYPTHSTEEAALEYFQTLSKRASAVMKCAEATQEKMLRSPPLLPASMSPAHDVSPSSAFPALSPSPANPSLTPESATANENSGNNAGKSENNSVSGTVASVTAQSASSLWLAPLALYTKGLRLFQYTLRAILHWKQIQGYPLPPLQPGSNSGSETTTGDGKVSRSSGVLQKVDNILLTLDAQYRAYLRKAQQLRSRIDDDSRDVTLTVTKEGKDGVPVPLESPSSSSNSHNSLATSPSPALSPAPVHASTVTAVTENAEKMVYEWARQTAKEAALDELSGDTPEALSKYKRAHHAFELLLTERDATVRQVQSALVPTPESKAAPAAPSAAATVVQQPAQLQAHLREAQLMGLQKDRVVLKKLLGDVWLRLEALTAH